MSALNIPRYNLTGYNSGVLQSGDIEIHSINSFQATIYHSLPLSIYAVAEFGGYVNVGKDIVVPHKINLYAYNLSAYNSSIRERILQLRGTSVNRFGGVAAPTVVGDLRLHSFNNFRGELNLRRLVVMETSHTLINFEGDFRAYRQLIMAGRSLNEFDGEFNAVKDIYLSPRSLNEIKANIHVGKSVYIFAQSISDVASNIHVGKHILITANSLIYFNASTQINLRDYQVMEIAVTIPPGGEIRINSDNFTVTQGANNIIHLHNGDWIFIERATHTLRVEAATGGNIVGQLLYTERYI